MEKVLIVCVNYNSYDALYEYLESIVNAYKYCDEFSVFIKIGDNSTQIQEINTEQYNLDIEIFQFGNIGYFGAATKIINGLSDIESFNYVFITNVDVVLSADFFAVLYKQKYSNDTAWIAPKIYSSSENKNRNPKIISRLSKKKISVLQLFYKFPLLNVLYEKFFYGKRQLLKQNYESGYIYAGHGSFIILTKCFFLHYRTINYPIFMFGEEIFLAELIKNKSLRVYYDSMLQITDKDHISTGVMKKKIYYKYNYDAITYLKHTFYE